MVDYTESWDTKIVIEHLMFISQNLSNLKKILEASRVISYKNNRYFSPRNQSGEINICDGYDKPYFIIIIDKLISVFVINPNKEKRVRSMMHILGNKTYYYPKISDSNIKTVIQKYMCIEEMLPTPTFRQIYFFPYVESESKTMSSEEIEAQMIYSFKNNEENLKSNIGRMSGDVKIPGYIFTEMQNNKWIMGQPFNNITLLKPFVNNNGKNLGQKAIINELFKIIGKEE